MGAETFKTVGHGATANEAFDAAVSQAQYDHGHAGYTGTIAEKDEFSVISDSDGTSPEEANALADKLMDEQDERIDDKWGPAGAIRFEAPGDMRQWWLFFGWASS